ncbi:MAG: c-type cytochrome [Nitrospirae bacterium]|nr:c-type cytochrome [Nitrospirota bacterium]
MASSSRLKPGEKGRISVSVDVRGKRGSLTKTIQVYANDQKRPVTTLSLRMYLKDTAHLKVLRPGEIFVGNCRVCHVEQGRGKKGFDLFRADCFMCHNAGKSAPTITEMGRKPREHLLKAIRNGVENSMMPGWDMKNGGPLTDEEIRSLINVIIPKTPDTVF